MGMGKPVTKWAMQELSGTTVSDTMGYLAGTASSGYGRRFNGSTSYVSFASSIIPIGAKTLRFKFRKNGKPSANQWLITTGNNTAAQHVFGVGISTSGGMWIGSYSNSQIGRFSVGWYPGNGTGLGLCDNKWHEVFFTWDGTMNTNSVKLFIDDMTTPTEMGTPTSLETSPYSMALNFGRLSGGASYYSGDLADIWVSNQADGKGSVVAYWKTAESSGNLIDSGPNGYTGTANATTVVSDIGPVVIPEKVFKRFSGSYIAFNNKMMPIGAKTVRFQMRKSYIPRTSEVIFDNGDATATNYGIYAVVGTNGGVQIRSVANIASNWAALFGALQYNINLCDNQWHDIMFTWDGQIGTNNAKLYVDDMTTPVATSNGLRQETTQPTYNLTLGRSAFTAQNYYYGDLKEFKIYNDATQSNLVYYWKLDETYDTAIYDSVNKVYNGTATSVTILADDTCRRFNGRTDRITFPNSDLLLGSKSIKFQMRKFELDPTGTYGRIISTGWAGDSSPDNAMEIGIRPAGDPEGKDGGVFFRIKTSSAVLVYMNSDLNVCDGQWHTVMVTVDTTARMAFMYIDDMVNAHKIGVFADGVSEPSSWSWPTMIGTMAQADPAANSTVLYKGDLKNVEVYIGSGTERTRVEDMQIGDFIAANYAAASTAAGFISALGQQPSSWIPPSTASATPNGGLYLIYVEDDHLGRKKLVADRTVQYSVSYETLNASGMASHSGVQRPVGLGVNLDPVTASPGAVFTAGNATWVSAANISSAVGVRSVRGKSSGKWYWEITRVQGGANDAIVGVCQVDFDYSAGSASVGQSTLQRAYISNSGKKYPGQLAYAATWSDTDIIGVALDLDNNTLEFFKNGASQGVAFTDLGSLTRPLYAHGWTSNGGQILTFNFGDMPFAYSAPAGFKAYNYNPANETARFFVRMPTGGINLYDTDNEWDKYVVYSDLNNTVIPGNNAIWNYTGIYTWVNSTWSGQASTSRTIRGNTSLTNYTYTASTTASSGTGFRPVVLVDVSPGQDKILAQDGTAIKTWNNGAWTTVGQAPVTDAMFANNSGCDLSTMDATAIQQLTSPSPMFLMRRVTTLEPPEMTMRAVPNPKVVLANGDIYLNSYAAVTAVSVTPAIQGSGIVRVIFSYDKGQTWYSPPTTTSAQTTAQKGISSTVSASSEDILSGSNAWKAFDQVYGASSIGGWQSLNNDIPAWISYDFGQPKILTSYTLGMRQADGSSCFPKAWEMQGYDNASQKWITVNSNVKSSNNWVNGAKQTYNLQAACQYSKYRIYITQTFGASYVDIGEIELIGPGSLQAVDTTSVADVKAKSATLGSLGLVPTGLWMLGRNLAATDASPSPDTLRFGYYLEQATSTLDLAAVDVLSLTVTMNGSWDMAIEGTEYSYSYPARDTLRIKVMANGDYKVNY